MVLVTSENCPGCDELKRELVKEDIAGVLEERYGSSQYDELKVEEDKTAARILASLQDFSTPNLVLLDDEGKKACVLDEFMKVKKCVDLVDLPD